MVDISDPEIAPPLKTALFMGFDYQPIVTEREDIIQDMVRPIFGFFCSNSIREAASFLRCLWTKGATEMSPRRGTGEEGQALGSIVRSLGILGVLVVA